MNLSPAIPILRIFSVDKAREFYVDFLGFTVDWQHRFGEDFPLYMQVSRSGLTLHLSEHHGDATPGSAVYVRIDDVDSLQQELIAKQYTYAKPGVVEEDWARQVRITDPFGNRLCFSQEKD
nr:glyoxalase superfamily protein [uncultured Cupriavidus sp.]